MSLVNKILKEAKEVGSLYHYTNFKNLIAILNDNALKVRNAEFQESNKKFLSGFSTTRDKNFHNNDNITEGIGISVRIELDGDKLSNKYRIIPYNYWSTTNKTRPKNTESEEFVVTNHKNLRNLKDYVINISLFPEKEPDKREVRNIGEIIDKLKASGVPYDVSK